MWIVHAREQQPPAEVAPLEWFLLSTCRWPAPQTPAQILHWYTLRWRIERLLPGPEVRRQGGGMAASHGCVAGAPHRDQDGRSVACRFQNSSRILAGLRKEARRERRLAVDGRRWLGCTRPARRTAHVARLHPNPCHDLRLRTARRVRNDGTVVTVHSGTCGKGSASRSAAAGGAVAAPRRSPIGPLPLVRETASRPGVRPANRRNGACRRSTRATCP